MCALCKGLGSALRAPHPKEEDCKRDNPNGDAGKQRILRQWRIKVRQ